MHKQAEEALEGSLKALDTPYLDLWLLHWVRRELSSFVRAVTAHADVLYLLFLGQPAPMIGGKADKTHDWVDTWKSMEALYKKYPEKVKAIGKAV